MTISAFAKAADEKPQSSGTGFVVSRQGHLLTNHHVVHQCPSVRVNVESHQKELAVVGLDKENDLAILKLPKPASAIARFRQGRSIRAGDSIVVVGFPYHGLLALEANVTTGTVSALAGIRNDTRFLQIAAPVQPGNSGGPVLDNGGHVVGVVQSKLNAIAMAILSGDLPQNVNFAVKDAIAKSFLDSHGVVYETAASDRQLEQGEIGELGKQFTVLIECYPENLEAKKQRVEAERRAEAALKEAERKAQTELKRKQEAARELARILEAEERARIAKQKEAERRAAEQEQYRQKREASEREAAEKRAFKELVESAEIQAASNRVTRFHQAEQEQDRLEEALRKGRQARMEAKDQRNDLVQLALHARRRWMPTEPGVIEEARRKGQASHAMFPLMSEQLTQAFDAELTQIARLKPIAPMIVLESSKTRPYWAWMEGIISAHWQPPQGLSSKSATVQFRFFPNGTVEEVAVKQPSGEVSFDDAALRAVLSVRQFPPFPPDMARVSVDIEMRFPGGQPSASEKEKGGNAARTSASSAFELVRDYYMRGQYDVAVEGFQWFINRYPYSPLMPQAHYWTGEAYYQQKQYMRALRAFHHVVSNYAGTESVPGALYKMGVVAAESGDMAQSIRHWKRLVDQFPASEEANLAKTRLVGQR